MTTPSRRSAPSQRAAAGESVLDAVRHNAARAANDQADRIESEHYARQDASVRRLVDRLSATFSQELARALGFPVDDRRFTELTWHLLVTEHPPIDFGEDDELRQTSHATPALVANLEGVGVVARMVRATRKVTFGLVISEGASFGDFATGEEFANQLGNAFPWHRVPIYRYATSTR